MSAAKQGLPLTLSLTLLAISSVTDRFVIANLVTPAEAGRYIAGLDLVRQTLMMPAISAAAVFFPLAIKIHASEGPAAVRSHLAECVELLLSITLPACLGFAMIAPHVANVILGADFRELAAQTMPIVAVAVIFQILTQQYLHASFLLSGRNSFYLINTASIIVVNVVLSCLFVSKDGTIGARVGSPWRRPVRLCRRLAAQPPRVSDPTPPWPAGADRDRRIGHGADRGNAGPKSARLGSDGLLHPGCHRDRQLRAAVLAA